MAGTYTYEPAMITSYGKDRMRFELGDVMVDGKERTCALADEEYNVLCVCERLEKGKIKVP